MKKALKISKSVLGYMVITMLVIWLCVSVVSFVQKKPFRFLGFGYALVVSESMEPNIHKGSFIWIVDRPFEAIEVGDDIVYKSSSRDITIIHRVVQTEGGIITKGTNNTADDYLKEGYITKDRYLGTVTASGLTWLGTLLLDGRSTIIGVVVLLLLFLLIMQFVSLTKQLKEKQEKEHQATLDAYKETLIESKEEEKKLLDE